MKKIVLYYFTGSGNTLLIAKRVKKQLEDRSYEVMLIDMADHVYVSTKKAEFVGLLFPVAIQSTYPLVWKFLNNLPVVDKVKVFMIDTLVSFSGGIVGPLRKILDNKGYDCVGAIELKMTSSMEKKFITDDEKRAKNEGALKSADDFIETLLKGQSKWPRLPLLSDLMRKISMDSGIWEKTSKKKTVDHNICIKCGICVKSCPVDAMVLEGKVVIDHKTCISCMRCLNICPPNAFRIDGKSLYQQIKYE